MFPHSETLNHSDKYKKLIRDIQKYKDVQATGRYFSIHGYVRRGFCVSEKTSQILFRTVPKSDPHGVLISEDRSKIDIIHDFSDIDSIFNKHRFRYDYGDESLITNEYVCDFNRFDTDSSDEDIPYVEKDVTKPVFSFSWSVFEDFLTDGCGVIIDDWIVPNKV